MFIWSLPIYPNLSSYQKKIIYIRKQKKINSFQRKRKTNRKQAVQVKPAESSYLSRPESS